LSPARGASTKIDSAAAGDNVLSDGAIITNNQITGNVAGDHGGGIHVADELYGSPLDIEVSWNLVAHNVALWKSGVDADGGGVWVNRTSA
jgi:hypothetical protein